MPVFDICDGTNVFFMGWPKRPNCGLKNKMGVRA